MDKLLNKFYLDNEKDIVVSVYKENNDVFYIINTPNHKTDNLITNLAKLTKLKLEKDKDNNKYIKKYLPAFITSSNKIVYIMRLCGIKIANINEDGSIEQKATIPAINKTLMSQTKDYKLSVENTIIKTYVKQDNKFRSDLHTHMNGNLSPDILIALGIYHQIAYPYYYVKKLDLTLTKKQLKYLNTKRKEISKQFINSPLQGKYLERRIDDNTTINFADLIVNNIDYSADNINKIRNSLSILKDSQAVFTDLEKLYLYRYIFTKPRFSDKHISLSNVNEIKDDDVRKFVNTIILDHKNKIYKKNSLLKDKLLWIARSYKKQGIKYVEISNTLLTKDEDNMYSFLQDVHQIMPSIIEETGVTIRFLAAIRRIPLSIIKDDITPENYLRENLDVIKAVSKDPYVAGCDIVGEEINDIEELQPVIKELVNCSKLNNDFTIRIHAGENDSLKDNVSKSIKCIKNSLENGQKIPRIRIGHGLYTENIQSKNGQKLIKDLKKYNVILEFQLTSNVRLNNLTNLANFPLKKYLANGVKCVQGSDGCGLYGINSMEEQLSLQNLIKLSDKEIKEMCEAEKKVINENIKCFNEKIDLFNKYLNGRTIKEALKQEIKENRELSLKLSLISKDKLDSSKAFSKKIMELPLNKLPIIVAGGSFNTAYRITKTNSEDKVIINNLLKTLDPTKVYFVIGNKMNGYEKYLVDKNKKFDIFAIVPSLINKDEYERIKKKNIKICLSQEPIRMALYKSFNTEIFEKISSVLLVLDGNSAAANLIQEARNGKEKSLIFISKNSLSLKDKAKYLKGYVKLINSKTNISSQIKSFYH